MKFTKLLSVLAMAAGVIGAASMASSCDKDKGPSEVAKGTVSGTVTNNLGTPLIDVEVSVKGTEIKTLSLVDGTYTLSDVPMTDQTIVFTKNGYAMATVPLKKDKFADGKAAGIDAMMEVSNATIKGRCIDAKNANAPMAGVTVKLNGATTITTAADGIFSFDNLTIDEYTVSLSAPECVDITKTVSAAQFTGDFVVDLGDIRMGAKEVLPWMTAADLKTVDVWHYNEYRGGKNGDDYPHFDWSTDFMGTLTGWMGCWEEQNEGSTIQIRNNPDNGERNNPADLENFDSYLVGRKKITADNCKMYLKVRTHSESDPTRWAVKVVDLSQADPDAVMVGEVHELASSNYSNPDYEFDLTPWVGKEIAIAIGIYRTDTGNFWRQLVIRRMAFAATAPSEWGYLPGTPVDGLHEDYKMTQEMVRSTMPVTEFNEFTGLPQDGWTDEDGPGKYRNAYAKYRGVGHFAAFWSCMPIRKDNEPQAGEGFIIKTNGGGTPVSTEAPQSYFYAKFAIAAGHNTIVLKARNFSDNPTYFKLTAITEDCSVVKNITPTATTGVAAADGCWKFSNQNGGADDVDAYSTFTYDLSEFNDKNVVVALAVFKGEDNGDENKLSIYSVSIK